MSKQIFGQTVSIRQDMRPGDVDSIIHLHCILYADQGWDYTFKDYVATPLNEFANLRTSRQRIWIVENKKRIVGSVAIVKYSDNEAQLRWLLLNPEVRGQGLGRRLVEDALEFGREAGYSSVFLWTVNTLPVAAKLYQSMGFRQTQELTHEIWGCTVTEVKYELALK